jgi:hypothetical protein
VIDPRENELLSLLKKDDQSAIKIIFEKYHASLCIFGFSTCKKSRRLKVLMGKKIHVPEQVSTG